jgi:HEAT repeat protein
MTNDPAKTPRSRLLAILGRIEIEDFAAEEVAALGKSEIDFLLEIAKGNASGVSPYQRRNAVLLIGLLKIENDVGGLADLLNDKDAGLRLYAIRALGRIGTVDASQPLRGVLQSGNATLAELSYALQALRSTGRQEDLDAVVAFGLKTRIPFLAERAVGPIPPAPQRDRGLASIREDARTGRSQARND